MKTPSGSDLDRSSRRSMRLVPRLFARTALLLATLVVAASGCDNAPGLPDLISDPPRLANFTLTPQEFVYTGDDPVAQIPLEVGVDVQGPASGAEVRYVVRPQFGTEVLAEGTLASTGGGRFEASTTLEVPRGETGLYVVTVTVSNDRGAVGNLVTGLLRFTAESLGPPVIEAVDFPATVTRPAAGEDPVPIPIVATVTDPDGQSNISRVVVRTQGGGEFELRDDGGAGSNSGDQTAGDGRYTVTFQVESTNSPGPNVFTLQAFDRSGQASDPVEITITIE